MATIEATAMTGRVTRVGAHADGGEAPRVVLGQRELGGDPSRRRKAVGRMGPWQLVRVLGEGALTRVYLARPADADGAAAAYAVKSLKREWWSEPAAIEAQRREAWVGTRVSHPNLAPVLSSHVAAPPFYVVTPYLAGETAAAMLAAGRRPPMPLGLWIARQGAEALAALHAATGMVHGDVKPANLMVGPDGHTTLIDTGFCQSPEESRSWATRPVVGTLHYMAPERFTSASVADARSDLYSLGVTLYELLVGRPPLDADSPAALLTMHREAKPTCLRTARPNTPKSVASLVHRMLAKDPMRRPATAAEVAGELVRLEIECFGLR
ncbi:MAG: serine/threonine-protein kinase [Lacipirellulaceae bacterium]